MTRVQKRVTAFISALSLCLMFVLVSSAVGYIDVFDESNILNVKITAQCFPGYVSQGEWGSTSGKTLSSCYVRLVQGSYDSGRVDSVKNGSFQTATTSRVNNPLNTAYTYWGWYYS